MAAIVTVLMSVYNGERFLKPAIDSILSQTFEDFEFVIYDDCSTDNTAQIIKSYNDRRIVYRRNGTNQGLTWNLADGVARSEATYIARMDADDIAYPDRLEKQVDWLNGHKGISILGSPVSYFQDMPGDGGLSSQPSDDTTIKATLFISFTLMHPSIMIRRADMEANGLNYNPNYRYSQDHALYLDCIRAGLKFANYTEPLLHMRSHQKSISRHHHEAQQECSKRVRRNFVEETGLANGCTDEEIDVYNNFASGEFPDSIEKIRQYEIFVKKVCGNPKIHKYFDSDILKALMAEKLSDMAYFAIDNKNLRIPAKAARRSSLMRYAKKWSVMRKIKFFMKQYV